MTIASATSNPRQSPALLHAQPVQSYSSNPVLDAERHQDSLALLYGELCQQEALLATNLLQAVAWQPLQAQAAFAPRITDYSQGAAHAFKRHPTLAEVLVDALDYPSGPSHDDLLAFVAGAANTGNAQALALLRRMAFTWASHHAYS